MIGARKLNPSNQLLSRSSWWALGIAGSTIAVAVFLLTLMSAHLPPEAQARSGVIGYLTGLLPYHSAANIQSAQPSAYRILTNIPLPGDGTWDHLTFDAASRRLYVTHQTHVDVVNVDSGHVLGSISDSEGVRGVALVPELGRGFITNGASQSVTVFDLNSLQPLQTVKIPGSSPSRIVYDPGSQMLFTMNTRSQSATAIRAKDSSVAATLSLVDDPVGAAVDGAGHLYVNLADPSEIAVIDIRSFALTARIPLAPCNEPHGLSVDYQHRRLFSACSNALMAVVDPDARRIVAMLPIGDRANDVAYDAGPQLVFSANAGGSLTMIREDSPNSFRVMGEIPTRQGAQTLTIDPQTHDLYLPTADFEGSRIDKGHMVKGSFKVLVIGR